MKKYLLSFLVTLALLLSIGMPVSAAITDTGFSDVSADSWYAEAVTYCLDNNIMSGVSDTEFAPSSAMSRAMLATVLWRINGSETATGSVTFNDVAPNAWYTEAVRWAVQAGIISGYNTSTFGVNDTVTREQIATMLHRYEQYKNGASESVGTLNFADADSISNWARSAVLWAAESGIVSGRTGNLFDPSAGATRAEVAVMLHRYLTATNLTVSEEQTEPLDEVSANEDGMIAVKINVGNKLFNAKFYDNESTRILIEQMPMTLNMSDYARQEKVTTLPYSFPSASTERPPTIRVGDIYLWSGNQLVLFYTTFSNSYSYVPVGHIEDITGLVDALGSGDATITFSLD